MPRYVLSKTKLSTKDKLTRANHYRVSGFKGWNDPFPVGFGTMPEKIVYEALSYRGIPFLYLNDVHFVFPEIGFDKTFQADFIIPSLMIIIEVNGAHWHSMPKTIESDAFKYAIYQQGGYRILPWWDFDILDNVNKLFMQDPQLSQYGADSGRGSSELPVSARTKTDTSQGIRTLNKKRGARLQYRKKSVTLKNKKQRTYGSYGTPR